MLFNAGKTPEEIAGLKNVGIATVYSHLIQWIDEGKVTEFRRLTTEKDLNTVSTIYASDPENAFTRLRDQFNIPSHIIRAILAELRTRQ